MKSMRHKALPVRFDNRSERGGLLRPKNRKDEKNDENQSKRVPVRLSHHPAAPGAGDLRFGRLGADLLQRLRRGGGRRGRIAAGSTVTASNGQQIPSSILYTDAAGGGTNYLPLRTISELLGIEVGYDAATKTAYIGQQPESIASGGRRWQKEIDGKKVTYFCEEEGHTYAEPLTYRLTWPTASEGWGLTEISHDKRNYTTSWEYRGPEGTLTLQCANPSTAGFARQMNSADAIENCQTITVDGHSTEYYQDGDFGLLVWENPEGILFYLSGRDVPGDMLREAAESIERCTEETDVYALGWVPQAIRSWTAV